MVTNQHIWEKLLEIRRLLEHLMVTGTDGDLNQKDLDAIASEEWEY